MIHVFIHIMGWDLTVKTPRSPQRASFASGEIDRLAYISYYTDSDTRVAHVAVFLRRTMLNCQKTPQETADGRFPVTRWSVVVAARGDGDSARRALNELCAQYWLPVYSFIRRKGHSPADAEDLTQGFFAEFLSRSAFDGVAEEKGRLRTFLLKAVTRHMGHELEKNTAAKRGGGVPVLSLDVQRAEGMYLDEPGHHLTPDLEFERQWVLALLDRALDAVRVAAAESAQAGLFEDLKGLISLASPVAPYEDIAFRHGLSESAVKSTAQRLRQEFRTVVRALVAETVASDEEIDEEIRHLFTLFAS
jgi:RNA polymerase sigma-70 factor (ECF subfamily)